MLEFYKITDSETQKTLLIDGEIAKETWFGDEIQPKKFREALFKGGASKPVQVIISSPGGDVFAASQIYTMLREYPQKVVVKIEGLAASAASVVAMAGDETLMSRTALMMIHNPETIAEGETKNFEQVIEKLNIVKESIINAYEKKTKLSREAISDMMDNETWFDSSKALELGFIDGVMDESTQKKPMMFTKNAIKNNSLVNKIVAMYEEEGEVMEKDNLKEIKKTTGAVDNEPLTKAVNEANDAINDGATDEGENVRNEDDVKTTATDENQSAENGKGVEEKDTLEEIKALCEGLLTENKELKAKIEKESKEKAEFLNTFRNLKLETITALEEGAGISSAQDKNANDLDW